MNDWADVAASVGELVKVDGVGARINGADFTVIDLSYHGVRLTGGAEIGPVDALVGIDFSIPVFGTVSIFRVDARVVWSGRKEIALAFEDPGPAWRRIVKMLHKREERSGGQPAA